MGRKALLRRVRRAGQGSRCPTAWASHPVGPFFEARPTSSILRPRGRLSHSSSGRGSRGADSTLRRSLGRTCGTTP
eukprot:8561090-Pyramimonas_sp.AAC.1